MGGGGLVGKRVDEADGHGMVRSTNSASIRNGWLGGTPVVHAGPAPLHLTRTAVAAAAVISMTMERLLLVTAAAAQLRGSNRRGHRRAAQPPPSRATYRGSENARVSRRAD